MTLLNLLNPDEMTTIMESVSDLTPSDFEREFADLSFRELSDYAYALNTNASRFIVTMGHRASKQGGALI